MSLPEDLIALATRLKNLRKGADEGDTGHCNEQQQRNVPSCSGLGCMSCMSCVGLPAGGEQEDTADRRGNLYVRGVGETEGSWKEGQATSSDGTELEEEDQGMIFGGRKDASESSDHLVDVLQRRKKELAALLHELASEQRQLDSTPRGLELTQYQERISELLYQLQLKSAETQSIFIRHNALAESLRFLEKESSLLSSIGSQLDNAMLSSAGRASLVRSLEVFLKNVSESRKKRGVKLDDDLKKLRQHQGRESRVISPSWESVFPL